MGRNVARPTGAGTSEARGANGQLAGDVDVDGVAIAAAVEAGEVDGRLAQGLGGEGAGVHARPAEDGLALDQRHALAEVRRLRGTLLARGTRADDDEIVHTSREPERRLPGGWPGGFQPPNRGRQDAARPAGRMPALLVANQ